ncbi:DUF7878 domain-containing protein [Cytobacillus sp. FSL K6-0265]|uniref:DUF7878 domain-containing protein n=1 Tax=Cytobacillus sp. FSL K6-0265 TaxID=2921448 RepID=UPI0030FB197D
MEQYQTNTLHFTYQFTCSPNEITTRHKRDTAKILSIDIFFTIKINHQLYFQADLPAFEFYKALARWRKKLLKNQQAPFRYFSIEYDEGAILEMIPFHQLARLVTIWPEAEVYNVFAHQYLVNELSLLERTLKNDIERYFDIKISPFMRHIPYREQC